jgi:pyruvate formate lyase activating enzyme
MTHNQSHTHQGIVLDIQRMSTEDGPGLRTTVFLKGCSLKCTWCHNPESIASFPQIVWNGVNCIGCNICIETCKNNALVALDGEVVIDRTRCQSCGNCANECPGLAMECLGETWNSDALVAELAKDGAYFLKSSGGVTISGGEATLQSQFVLEVLKELKQMGIHTALDTCGHCTWNALNRLLPYTDLVLYDLKAIDPALHKDFTSCLNDIILANLIHLSTLVSNTNTRLWVRTPVIPGTTATDENIHSIGKFITKNLKNTVSKWELCSFNNLCQDKYLRLGLKWHFEDHELINEDLMTALFETAKKSGVDPQIVVWSGSIKS